MKMIPKVYYIILLMLALLVLAVKSTVVEQCGQTYQSPDGLTCSLCPPGTYMVKDCTANNTGGLCRICPKGSYEENCTRANHCEPCHPRCRKQYTEKVKDCTLYKDTECQCVEGRYRFNETDTDWVCLSHNPCMIGYGMVNLGTPHHDTQCEKCIAGETFSGTKSFEQCSPCTKCEVYNTQCTTDRDAECIVSWTNRSVTQAVEPKQNIDYNKGLIAGMVVLFVLCMCALAFAVSERCKRKARFCPCSEEDGIRDRDRPEMPPILDGPIAPNGVVVGGADREREPPDNPADQPPEREPPDNPADQPPEREPPDNPADQPPAPEETSSIESTSGTQDSGDPPSDLEEDNGAEDGLDTQNSLEDQDADELSSTASTSRDSQNGEGATSKPEHDVHPDDVTQQGQREDEYSKLHATEEGEGSMNKMLPIPDNPDSLPRLISQPTESIAHPHSYISSEFTRVHTDVHVEMYDLKESNSTEQGGKELDPLNDFGDSFVSRRWNCNLKGDYERGDRKNVSFI